MTKAFTEAQIADSQAISGGMLDSEEYFLWGLNEPSYVMKKDDGNGRAANCK